VLLYNGSDDLIGCWGSYFFSNDLIGVWCISLGSVCQTNIDDCVSPPLYGCQNEAPCIDAINSYTCSCSPWWTGRLCTQVIHSFIHSNLQPLCLLASFYSFINIMTQCDVSIRELCISILFTKMLNNLQQQISKLNLSLWEETSLIH